MPSAIALFTFNRLSHTQQTIDSLKRNDLAGESALFIFSDGPRNDADIQSVEEVRHYLASVTGFKSVSVFHNSSNAGLAKSVINGVTEVLRKHETVIVLEDDMVTSSSFLSYMNQGLSLYAEDEAVISVHGYIYPIKGDLPQTFFVRGAHCWGWATWRRGWALFEENGQRLLDELTERNLSFQFDYNGTYPFTKMLADQINGLNNSWAIRWHASAFLRNKLTLYPSISLLRNIGFDQSGTHSNPYDKVYDVPLHQGPFELKRRPVKELPQARERLVRFFGSIRPSLAKRVIRKLSSLLNSRLK
jgi:hypothetical protein